MTPEQARLVMRANGFDPIPASGKGVYLKGWQKLTGATEFDLKLWTRTRPADRSTGILTRRTPTLDGDIVNEEAAEACAALVHERFDDRGAVMERFGRPPKRAFPFKSAAPFAKILVKLVSALSTDADPERLEFLADGQMFVAHGIHEGTGKPYSWHGGSPGSVKRDDLPEISEAEARKLVDDLVKLLVDQFGYRVWKSPSAGRALTGAPGERCDWGCTPADLMDHDRLAALAMSFATAGMSDAAVVNFLHTNVSILTDVDDDRRGRRLDDIPDVVTSARAKLDAIADRREASHHVIDVAQRIAKATPEKREDVTRRGTGLMVQAVKRGALTDNLARQVLFAAAMKNGLEPTLATEIIDRAFRSGNGD